MDNMATQPTDIEKYQLDAAADTLYYAKNSGRGQERQRSIIEVTGGTVNVLGSLHKPVTPLTDMTETAAGFSGIDTFASVPTWLYFETVSGAPVVTLSSIELELAV